MLKQLLILLTVSMAWGCTSSKTLSRANIPVTHADEVWSHSNVAAFEERLEALRNRYHIPSLAIGIVNEKKLVVTGGLGYADREKQIAPDENTVYQLASITKT